MSSLPALFLESCVKYPERTAVVAGSRILSYQELAEAAGSLAAELGRRGVSRGELVGVRLARSADAVVAIVGVLLSGAAYVPLDPRYPADRLRLMTEECRITHTVGENVPVWGHPAASVQPELDEDDAAYVIYTSGSTGRPKGCVVTHGNVLSLLDAALPLFDVGPDDRWALFHSINFDFSVWEIWSALATGAAVVVVDEDASLDPGELLDLLIRERVTILNQVPSIFRMLIEAHEDEGCPPLPLRYLIFGGDAVDLEATSRFLASLPAAARPVAINMYGITETTVHSTFKELDPDTLRGSNPSPIGRPLSSLGITLRDPDGVEVPDGEVGEIWVSGAGVAAGYFQRDELTAERFVVVDGTRHYRSGDLARRLPDGEFQYLSRADRQVKLRGMRVELPEIEVALRACTGVKEAAVLLESDEAVGELLVAYVAAGTGFDPGQARAECARVLPSHMVPTRFERRDSLPLSPSGKVDYRALSR
ncbi:amino acid adenylation domain-containing protein [Streptosporangium canum]|uniref:amino acid adenylation domain-containing protein n=1 Tax=Streptosporangium canum TaxID=324952 RepID=UPI0033B1F654